MRQDIKYFIVESGPVFEVCRAWVQSFIDARVAAMEFSKKYGSERCYINNADGSFLGAQFPWKDLPDDWTKPRGRDNLSWPKKRSNAYKEQQALPAAKNFQEQLESVVGEIPSSISYKGDETVRGMTRAGGFFGVGCYTFNGADGPFLINPPNPRLTWQFMTADNPEYECTNGAHEYEFAFEGCREILKEEWDLMAARHSLKREAAA